MKTRTNPISIIAMETPFTVGPVNVYLIKDDPITLIDAGPNLYNSEDYLEAFLDSLGVLFSDIKRLILTHAHPDHMGLAMRIKDLSGTEIYLHQQEIKKINNLNSAQDERVSLFLQAGIPREVIEQVVKWNKETRSQFITKLDINSVISLRGDETFDFASGKLEVIHTPGHTPGHICLFEPDRKVLFSGDHLLANISPNPILELTPDGEGRNKSMLQYLESLRKITQKSPESIYPGHGRPFSDYPEVLDRFYHYFRLREEAVYQLMEQRGKTAYDIGGQLYPGAQGIDVFLGVCKAIGHLDILVEEGRVREQEIEGVSYFSL